MESIPETPSSALEQLPLELKDTVEVLIASMKPNSWTLEEYKLGGWNGDQVAKEFRKSSRLQAQFLPEGSRGVKIKVVAPKTMVVGLYPNTRSRTPMRYGLFTLLNNERYDQYAARESLLGNPGHIASHEYVDVYEATGKVPGQVSLILGSKFLQGLSVVDISKGLSETLSDPDAVVVYSLGKNLYFCANATQFLKSYAELGRDLGVRVDLKRVQEQSS